MAQHYDDETLIDLFQTLSKHTKKKGATDAVFQYNENSSTDISVSDQDIENVKVGTDRSVGITVHIGKKTGSARSTSLNLSDIKDAVESAYQDARHNPENPYAIIASPDDIARNFPDVDIYAPAPLEDEKLVKHLESQAAAAEEAAHAHSKKIKKTESAGAGYEVHKTILVMTNGFCGIETSTLYGIQLVAIAEENGEMVRDHDYSVAHHAEDLRSPADVGRIAAERTVASLNAVQPGSCVAPVVFDKRIANFLLGAFVSAINGNALIHHKTKLADKMGQRIFPETITIVDEPHVKRWLGSDTFDADGLPRKPITLAEDGVLKNWIFSVSSANEMNQKNGTSYRSTSHGGGLTNVFMKNGNRTVADLMADIKSGFYVTGLMGTKIDMATGDFSTGAQGFKIENGKRAGPVHEMTIGGDIYEMFSRLALANDIEERDHLEKSSNTPTARIDNLVMGGK